MAAFVDRADAGKRLGEALADRGGEHPVVLGLPRGGVPVAFEVARRLDAPLDVIVVRKLGLPGRPEVAMGAIGEGGARVLHRSVVEAVGVTEEELDAVERHERRELDRRVARLRGGRPRLSVEGRVVIIVDDGLATGSTAQVACSVVRGWGASKVVVAVPVGPATALDDLVDPTSGEPDDVGEPGLTGDLGQFGDLGRAGDVDRDDADRRGDGLPGVADEVVCLETPARFMAVGLHYRDFTPTTDEQVVDLLDRARAP